MATPRTPRKRAGTTAKGEAVPAVTAPSPSAEPEETTAAPSSATDGSSDPRGPEVAEPEAPVADRASDIRPPTYEEEASSSTTAPDPSPIADGVSAALAEPFVGPPDEPEDGPPSIDPDVRPSEPIGLATASTGSPSVGPGGDPVSTGDAAGPPQSPRDTPPAAPSRFGGFLALLLGGAAAAAIGFFVAREMLPVEDTSALRSDVAQQGEKLSSLASTVSALPDLSGQAGDIAAVRDLATKALQTADAAQKAAAAQPSGLEDLTARVAEAERRVADLASAASNAVDPAAVGALRDSVASVRSALDEAQKNGAELAAQAKAARDEAQKNGAEMEAQAKAAREAAEKAQADSAAAQAASAAAQAESDAARAEADAEAKAARLQAAAARIDAAMGSGQPFAQPLSVLKGAGVDVADGLARQADAGVPTLPALVRSFEAPARAALNAARQERMNGTLTDRFGAFLQSQTGARSLSPQEGDGPDAVLSRAEEALRKDDLQTTLTELGTLPEEAQAPMAAWMEAARARLAATGESAALTARLGKG